MLTMRTKPNPPANIDEYIASCPEEVGALLGKVRATISKAAPGAEEAISYRIPTFKLKGNLVHFAAFKNHIGFFPTSTGIANFKKELSFYKGAKGSVQFPYDKPIPYDLIRKIVKFRVRENLARAEVKAKKSTRWSGCVECQPLLTTDTRCSVPRPLASTYEEGTCRIHSISEARTYLKHGS